MKDDPDRPRRIVVITQALLDSLEKRKHVYTQRALDFGYAQEALETIVKSFQGVSDKPAFALTEDSLRDIQDLLEVREAKVNTALWDITAAFYTVASTASLTASTSNFWVSRHEPPEPPPPWSRKERIERCAQKLDNLDPELGRVARSVWQHFYGGSENAERSSLYQMRQLYDHFFSLIAPDEKVRESPFFKKKEVGKPNQVHRRERLKYAASERIADGSLAKSLDAQTESVLLAYEDLNEAHARGPVDRAKAGQTLRTMQAIIEQWVDGIEYVPKPRVAPED